MGGGCGVDIPRGLADGTSVPTSASPSSSAPGASSSAPSGTATTGTPASVITAAVGQCFLHPADTNAIDALTVVGCHEPHFGEVFFTFDIPGAEYPGDEAVTEAAADGCLPAFEDYVGIPYEESVYEIFPITPTRETWVEAGDREVICVLIAPDQANIVGSKRGANE